MPRASSASKSSSSEGADLSEQVSCTAGDKGTPWSQPGLCEQELRCHLQQPPPCSKEVWCFVISLKRNYFQGEIFQNTKYFHARPSSAPSITSRQAEASGTKLFAIPSPCKCLKCILKLFAQKFRADLGKSLCGIWVVNAGPQPGGLQQGRGP